MSARDDAIKALAKVADDWGWKGGKPGEITAGQLAGLRAKGEDYRADKILRDHVERFYQKYPNSPLSTEMQRNGTKWINNTPLEIKLFEDVMSALEQAGVPREWTGRLASVLPRPTVTSGITGKRRINPEEIERVSNLMRPMTNAQRETFLSLLPRWTGTLEQAASAAKKLYRR